MMKKMLSLALAGAMCLSLAACSPSAPASSQEPEASSSAAASDAPESSSTPAAGNEGASSSSDLKAFYEEQFSGEEAPMMMTVEDDEMLEGYYPGLKDIACKQRVVAMAAISAVAAEVALIEVENASDVDAVKTILQARIDSQVNGGAFYPAQVEAWQNQAKIVVRDNFVCLFVAENTDALVEAFNAL